ncbi:MAG: hypothetical protein ACOQNY_00755 [Mycoplasmoidaceae bacterium]
MRKITVAKVLFSSLIPTVLIGACVITTSCGTGASVSTKDLIVNPDSGEANCQIVLDEQPYNNIADVYINTASGTNQVQLLGPLDYPYQGSTTHQVLEVKNRVIDIRTSFSEYSGVSTNSKFNLSIKYKDKSQYQKTVNISGLKLELDYTHPKNEELHILNLNDYHGSCPGYGDQYFSNISSKNPGAIRIANEFAPIMEQYPGSAILTAGDNNSGECFSTSVHGTSTYRVLNSLGARYSAVGNHAFEWGLDPIAQFDAAGRTDATWGSYFVTSNIMKEKSTEQETWIADPTNPGFEADFNEWNELRVKWADPYKLLNLNGHLVCLIGLTTKLTNVDGNKSVTKDLGFIDYDPCVQYSVHLLQKEQKQWYDSVESYILLTHVESDASEDMKPKPSGNDDAYALAQNLTFNGVDAIISGHSHKLVCGQVQNKKTGKLIWLGQAGVSGRDYLDTTLDFDNSKEVGHRLSDIKMEVKHINFKNSSFYEAKQELNQIRENPQHELVKKVIAEYDIQKSKVRNSLATVVAHREDGLAYPGSTKAIGHEYFCSEQICDQLGAWVALGQLMGFTSMFEQDFEDISEMKYPSVSLLNIDTVNIQLPPPVPKRRVNVTLKELYSIQGYENPMYYGYLSIWQLANIVDYLLSGATEFNYSHNHDYYPLQTELSDKKLNDFTKNYHGKGGTAIDCLDPIEREEGKNVCNYLAGPLQWYGFRFEVEPQTSDKYDREYQLKYHVPEDATLKEQYDYVPNMWIYDPYITDDEGRNFSTFYSIDQWVPAEQWLKENRLVPVVVNSFVATAGNNQNTMFAKYFKYNNEKLGAYQANYSQLSREMLEEFCRVTEDEEWSDFFHFDLSNEQIVSKLVKFIE